MRIKITERMKLKAQEEAMRRESHGDIKHHFDVDHIDGDERNIVGFLGEFAALEMLGIDWESNIRSDYYTIDSGDVVIDGHIIDIKTETLYKEKLKHVLNGTINDDRAYGRRLVAEQQVPLLTKYDFVIWGGFARGDNYDYWYCFGYQKADYILDNYEVVTESPFKVTYPNPCIAVKQSDLLPISNLLNLLT